MSPRRAARPPDVVRARARTEGFGAPVDGVGGQPLVWRFGFGAVGLLVLAFLFFALDRSGLAVLAFWGGLVLAGLALIDLVVTGVSRSASWVFEGGIVDREGRHVASLAFRDLTDVREVQRAGEAPDEGGGRPTIRVVSLMQGDHVLRTYSGVVGADADAVGAAVLHAFHRGYLARDRALVESGEVVDYGAFAVGRDGVHLRDRVLPWTELRQVRSERGKVRFTPRRGAAVGFPFAAVRGGSATVALVQDLARAARR